MFFGIYDDKKSTGRDLNAVGSGDQFVLAQQLTISQTDPWELWEEGAVEGDKPRPPCMTGRQCMQLHLPGGLHGGCFAEIEARDAALEDGRVALADLRRQHDDAMTALRREADERETAASAYLDSERRRLEDERDALLAKATSEADKRHATMVEAFESERRRTEGLLRDAQAKYDELQDKYTNRPSRPEDVERIATLERENEEALRDVARMKEELVYFKRELINREENFNSRFAAGGALGASVGVMNVLNTGKARQKKPKNGFR